jgi:SAM-dependent methyltransferase
MIEWATTNEIGREMQGNKAQADYWSSIPGLKWIKFEDELDVVFDSVNQELIRRARPKPGERLLDIGCGTGATTRAFSQHLGPSGYVTSLDISAPLLKQAESRATEFETESRFCLLDAQHDEISGAPFDIATSRFGVMFFSDPIAAFTNVRRHLKPDGRLVIAAWAPIKGNPWFKVPKEAAAARLGPPDPSYPNAPGPLGFQNRDYVVEALEEAGFKDAVGSVVNLELNHPGPLRDVAALASNIGPAARILKKYDGNKSDIEAIIQSVLEKFQVFDTSNGACIPARINFFEATNPVDAQPTRQ